MADLAPVHRRNPTWGGSIAEHFGADSPAYQRDIETLRP